MFAALGTKVTVVERRERMLEFCDVEVVEALKYHLRDLSVTFRFGETVASVEAQPEGAIAILQAGRRSPPTRVMYPRAARARATCSTSAPPACPRTSAAGRGRRVLPHRRSDIYAVGDIIGFPALAATSAEQGRLRRTTPR